MAGINSMNDIAFVVLSVDFTELRTDVEIKLAKEILSELKVPYYILAGNHDTGWSFGEFDRPVVIFSIFSNGIIFLVLRIITRIR